MYKAVLPPSSDGLRERVSEVDEVVGYVTRRLEKEDNVVIPCSNVLRIIKYLNDYKTNSARHV